jgi:hypothetical protein
MVAFRFEDKNLNDNVFNFFDFEFENWTWNYYLNDYDSRNFYKVEKCTA